MTGKSESSGLSTGGQVASTAHWPESSLLCYIATQSSQRESFGKAEEVARLIICPQKARMLHSTGQAQ
jgi:hypothetical protein